MRDARAVLLRGGLDALIAALEREGRRVLGPVVRDGAVCLGEVARASDLPWGIVDEQQPGRYRLTSDPEAGAFAHVVGPHSAKRALHPPRTTLFTAQLDGSRFHLREAAPDDPPLAILGARACDLHAIAIQDRVLAGGPFVDPGYASRRAGLFVVAVQCGRSVSTCFCASMGTGPRARAGYDLALTEVRREGSFEYVVEVGSEAGERLLATLPHRAATADDGAAIEHAAEGAAAEQVRSMRDDAVQVLLENVEHPRWDDVAARCLACGNCTMVCPTCFCTTVEDTTSLAGDVATRERRWDSCFTADFSHIVGGPVRRSTRSRYRQWLTHKVATWHEQFGTSGCVGCGRCITWCPVGIDLVEEVRALAGPPASSPE